MSLVGSTVTLIIKDGTGTLEISGDVIEIYRGKQQSFREVLDGNTVKRLKIDVSTDYYLIELASNKYKHVLCSDVLEIVP
jgi:hypothetical protein